MGSAGPTLDSFAESYLPLVESAEDQVLAMEEQLFEALLPDEQISVLFRLRRQLILLQRVLGPVSKVVARLRQMNPRLAGAESPDFRGAQDGLHRIESRVEGLWQVVTSVAEMSNLMEQQRQGSASRKLAAWASIVAVPTALSGIFGMNFIRMPGTDVEYGYRGAGSDGRGVRSTFVRFKRLDGSDMLPHSRPKVGLAWAVARHVAGATSASSAPCKLRATSRTSFAAPQ